MRMWVGPLGATNIAPLGAIAGKLVPAISKADEALSTVSLTEQKMDTFMAGPRTAFVGETNALRKVTKGKISEIVHGSPDLHLPSDFADRFFLSTGGSRTPTLTEIEQTILRLEAKLERHKAQRAALEEKEARQLKAKQEAELAEKQAKLEAAQKRAEEAAQDLARIKAEMGG